MRTFGSGYPHAVAAPEADSEHRKTAELEAELREARAQNARLERELQAAGRELERVKRSRSWRATEPLRAAKARLGGRP
jgi:hypothetical protein